MKNSDSQKYYCILTGLDSENVQSIYQRQFNYWRLLWSEKVIYKGNRLNTEEFALMVIGGLQVFDMEKQGFQVDDQNGGFPLLEKNFIEEEISIYTKIHKDTFGDPFNRVVHLKTDIYLKFLKDKQLRITEIENKKIQRIPEVEKPSQILKTPLKNFGFSKESKIPVLLYAEFSDNQIISDSVNKVDFIKGITSDWKTTNVKIKIVNTTLFAFIISELKESKIKSYFDNFNFANVGKSEIFFTEDTDYIRPNTLSSSKRSAKENGSISKYRIQSQLIISNLSSLLFPEK